MVKGVFPMKLKRRITRFINIVRTLGLFEALLTIFKAKVLGDRWSFYKMVFAVRRIKMLEHIQNYVRVLDREHIMFRDQVFLVPQKHFDDFFYIVGELCSGLYRFSMKHDTVVDVGGFLGETAWWFMVEGFGRRVVVYEPVYYEICKRNLSDVADVYPYAIYKERGRIRLIVEGGRSRVSTEEIGGNGIVEVKAVLDPVQGLVIYHFTLE